MLWRWKTADTEVELDYSIWSGRKRLRANDCEVGAGGGMSLSWRYDLDIGGEAATVRTRLRWLLLPQAELEIGGRIVEPIAAPRPVPPWAWLFFAASLAILVVSRGGAIPGAFAGVGAVGSVYLSRLPASTVTRVALCAGATALGWGAYAAFVRLIS